MSASKFSKNLKFAMSSNNMVQKDLARLLGTTQQTVSRWLNGINEPDYATLIDICLYLNETPSSLLGFDDIPEQTINESYQKAKDIHGKSQK